MMIHHEIQKWSPGTRLVILYATACLPMVMLIGTMAYLWIPDIQPGTLLTVVIPFLMIQAVTMWTVWVVIRPSATPASDLAGSSPEQSLGDTPAAAHEEIFHSEINKLFNVFMEHLPAVVLIKDDQGRYLYVNSTCLEVLGKSADQLVGRRDDEVWPPEFSKQIKEMDALVLSRNQVLNTVEDLMVNDEPRYLSVIKFSIGHDEDETLLGCIIFDITEKIRAQEDKAQLESQLIQSQKMQAIGTLAGGIAHDFNNILAAIFGYVELARLDLNDNQRAEKQLNQVLKAAQRAKELVHQILAFSRKQEQERRPLDLTPLVKESMKLLRATLPTSIEIIHQFNAKESLVMADATQIHQVIMNLCTNASHAMENGGGRLTLSLEKRELATPGEAQQMGVTPGNYVELSVTDTGIGINASQIKRIFEPYYTTKPKGKGTGMGLSVAHGIVESHGGTIRVESCPGKGSCFRILFPVTTQRMFASAVEDQYLPKGSESILFVDDEKYLGDVGQQMLTRLGYRVTSCGNPLDALDLLKKNPDEYDLLITDMTMPHMTGDMLAKDAMAIRPDIPVVLCTGYSELMTAEKANQLGIAAFLMKPFTISDMACTVKAVLSPPGAHESVKATAGFRSLAN
jgi:PAS domain S-box-containing protein